MRTTTKNMKNDDEAVSPVIATILMVAITVVLAGVLFVWANSLAEGNQTDGPSFRTFSVDDASGEVNADGNNTLVYFEMTNGAPINWAFIQVTITVDGQAQTVCEGPSNVDETGCKVVDNGDGDTEFEVTDGRIIVQEESDICASACSIVVTIFDTQNQQQMYQSGAIAVQ